MQGDIFADSFCTENFTERRYLCRANAGRDEGGGDEQSIVQGTKKVILDVLKDTTVKEVIPVFDMWTHPLLPTFVKTSCRK